MDQSSFQNALERASALINSKEFNQLVESKASSTKKKNGGSDLSALDAQVFGTSTSSKPITDIVIPSTKPNKPNMPSEIMESFSKMPPMTMGMDAMMPPASYSQPKSVPQRQIVTEQVIQQQPTMSIDYNYIKYLINECIKENLNTLNESANLNGIKIANGKIELTDSKGNVYEGVLKRKK